MLGHEIVNLKSLQNYETKQITQSRKISLFSQEAVNTQKWNLNIPLTVALKKFFSNKSKQNIKHVLYAGVVDHNNIALPLGICLTQQL